MPTWANLNESHLAGASLLPHSRHDNLKRGVINPQCGHTLGVDEPRRRDVSKNSNAFASEALTWATRLRKRASARSSVSFMKTACSYHGTFGPTNLSNIAHK